MKALSLAIAWAYNLNPYRLKKNLSCFFYHSGGRCGRGRAFAFRQTSPPPSAGRGVPKTPQPGFAGAEALARGNHF